MDTKRIIVAGAGVAALVGLGVTAAFAQGTTTSLLPPGTTTGSSDTTTGGSLVIKPTTTSTTSTTRRPGTPTVTVTPQFTG